LSNLHSAKAVLCYLLRYWTFQAQQFEEFKFLKVYDDVEDV